jgi:hypothetical protein
MLQHIISNQATAAGFDADGISCADDGFRIYTRPRVATSLFFLLISCNQQLGWQIQKKTILACTCKYQRLEKKIASAANRTQVANHQASTKLQQSTPRRH